MNGNGMGDEGAASLAEALKVNTTLQSTRCASKALVLAFAHKRQRPLTLNAIFVGIIHSLNGNQMKAEGAAFLAEALEVNTTLQSIRCASK